MSSGTSAQHTAPSNRPGQLATADAHLTEVHEAVPVAPSTPYEIPVVMDDQLRSSSTPDVQVPISDTEGNDAQILEEALRSKDRLFVLKLGDSIETLITEKLYVSLSVWTTLS